MSDFVMPSLGADREWAALVSWKVKPGDPVKRGDIIAEVETDKGVIEVEVFEDGIVEKLLVEPSAERLKVGTVLATLSGAGAKVSGDGKAPAPKAQPAP